MKGGCRLGLVVAWLTTVLGAAGCVTIGSVDPKSNIGPDKVVYHINDTEAQATNALRYIRNHLDVNP